MAGDVVFSNNPEAYRTDRKVIWCPGCGDFGVLEALCQAFSRARLDPANTVVVTGNGCSSMIGFFVNVYGIHGLHGRALPLALGVKLANPSLNVIVASGDGDTFAAGAGHLIHIARLNPDLKLLIMDNGLHGLTKGQASPTARCHESLGNMTAQPLNPVALLIMAGATFVAQGFSGDQQSLIHLMQQALDHPGFAVVHIISPCPVFNKHEEHSCHQSVTYIDPSTHPAEDRFEALRLAMTGDGKLRLGVYYRERRGGFGEQSKSRSRRDHHEDQGKLESIMDTLKV